MPQPVFRSRVSQDIGQLHTEEAIVVLFLTALSRIAWTLVYIDSIRTSDAASSSTLSRMRSRSLMLNMETSWQGLQNLVQRWRASRAQRDELYIDLQNRGIGAVCWAGPSRMSEGC